MTMDTTPVLVLNGKTVYALQPKQMECLALTPLMRQPDEDGPEHIGYGGAAGGGKSHLARAVAAVSAFRWTGSIGIIFRESYPELYDNHIVPFLTEVPPELYTFNEAKHQVRWQNGSMLRFGYLDNDKSVRRYQGISYDFMIFEEATHQPEFRVKWLTGNRLRANVASARPFALYPSNPGSVGHFWYKRLFIDREYDKEAAERKENYAFVQALLRDNAIFQERDPGYERRLDGLPEPYRSWLRDSNWNAGAGLALHDLSKDRHVIPAFDIPRWWTVFAASDWGYRHMWTWSLFACSPEGRLFVIDSFALQYKQDTEALKLFLDYSKEALKKVGRDGELTDIAHVVVGKDWKTKQEARGASGPSTTERAIEMGLMPVECVDDRVPGLRNLREYLAWKERGPDNGDGVPMLQFFRTAGNLKCFAQLESMPTAENNPEDAEKIDADEMGKGGDDYYDALRYACMSRPYTYVPPDPRKKHPDFEQQMWNEARGEVDEEEEEQSDPSNPYGDQVNEGV